ncbi:MAG: S-adenosyl-l-methionine hydroxide adenosyltransferase family protein [Candidatus Dormibacteria bacterium]
MSATVVFVTDYGLEDGYAAQLWAAAWSASPEVRCVDGTHQVPPGDALTAAYRCKTLARAFGPGSVLCAVVDPGVGGAREAVAVECDGVICVAPDTGLVSYLWSEARRRRAVRVRTPEGVSATFHGRDLFAPLAARLAAGRPLDECGEALAAPALREELVPVVDGQRVRSLVVSVDHFGNCITGVRPADLGERRVVAVRWPGGGTDRVVTTYTEIGTPVAALWNSSEHLELAAREASVAASTGLRVGIPVTVELA